MSLAVLLSTMAGPSLAPFAFAALLTTQHYEPLVNGRGRRRVSTVPPDDPIHTQTYLQLEIRTAVGAPTTRNLNTNYEEPTRKRGSRIQSKLDCGNVDFDVDTASCPVI
jgi:hypothetical protein